MSKFAKLERDVREFSKLNQRRQADELRRLYLGFSKTQYTRKKKTLDNEKAAAIEAKGA